MTSATRVFGDRQTGKTEMLLAFAEKLCRQGQRVLFVTHDHKLARNCLYRSAVSIEGIDGFRVYRSHGDERITHASGGELRFRSAGAAKPRGWTPDTLVMDDVNPDWGFGDPALEAKHVIKASL